MCLTLHTQHTCQHLTHQKFPCAERLHYERSSESSFYPYTGKCVGVKYSNKTDPNLPGGEPWELSDHPCLRCQEGEAKEAAQQDLLQEQIRREEARRKEREEDEGKEREESPALRKSKSRAAKGKGKGKEMLPDSGYLSQIDGAADVDSMDWEPEESFVRSQVRDGKGGFVEKEIEAMKEFQEKPCCAATCRKP